MARRPTVLPQDSMAHFWKHARAANGNRRKGAWWVVWAAMIWSIWLQRNHIIFNSRRCDIQQLFESVKCRSWAWLKATNEQFSPSFYEWQMDPCWSLKHIHCFLYSFGFLWLQVLSYRAVCSLLQGTHFTVGQG